MNLRKINKKGISHIEMILSFTIFVGFLLFVLFIFKPFRIEDKSDVHLDILEREILNYTSIQVDTLNMKLDAGFSESCFCFDYPDFDSANKIIAKNKEGNLLPAFYSGSQVCIQEGGDFYYIYSSKDFEGTLINCPNTLTEGYTLGLSKSYNMASSKKLIGLEESVKNKENYQQIKTEFRVPGTSEFLFSIRHTNQTSIISPTGKTPAGVRVLARDIPIQIVYNDGRLEYAILNIQIW